MQGALDLSPGKAPAEQAVGHPLEGFAVGSLPPQLGIYIGLHFFGIKHIGLHGLFNIGGIQQLFPQILPDAPGAIAPSAQIPHQHGTVFPVVEKAHLLQPGNGISRVLFLRPFFQKALVQSAAAPMPVFQHVCCHMQCFFPGIGLHELVVVFEIVGKDLYAALGGPSGLCSGGGRPHIGGIFLLFGLLAGELCHDLGLHIVSHFGMILEVLLGGITALAQALFAHIEPGARLLDKAKLQAHVHQLADLGDALAVHNIELGLLEGRCDLVLDHLGAGAAADEGGAVFQMFHPADLNAHGGVELQGTAAGGGFGVAVHDADLFAQLVDKNDHAVALGDGTGQLAQGLAHQTGLQAHEAVAHFAFDFSARHQCGHGVDNHDVHRAAAHEGFADLQRLLAGIGLGNIELVDVHAQLLGVNGIKGMLGVDEGRHAAGLLGLGHAVQGDGGLTGGFRSVDLHDAAAGQTSNAQRHIQIQTAGGNDLQVLVGHGVGELHDGALAVGLVQLCQRAFQRFHLGFFHVVLLDGGFFLGGFFSGHMYAPLSFG